MTTGKMVKITVHERLDESGFIVRVTAEGRAIKFPTDTQDEAILLAESIKEGFEAGIPLDALMPQEACVLATEGVL